MRGYRSLYRPFSSARRIAGFTLIELMVTLTVAAILLGVGVPSFRDLLGSRKVGAAANGFLAALRLARSEAIRRGRRVDLVPAGGGSDWREGWVVFVDENGDQKPGTGETVLFRHGPLAHGIAVSSTLSGQYLAYNGSGRTRSNASSQAPHFGSLSFSLDQQVRKVIVNFLGRARVCNPGSQAESC